MDEEKRTGFESLVDAAVEYREKERTLHLKLEDACTHLAAWTATQPGGHHGIELRALDELLVKCTFQPVLAELATLRRENPLVESKADPEPALFVGGTDSVVPPPMPTNTASINSDDDGIPFGPIDEATQWALRADHFTGEGFVEALHAYHRSLWRLLMQHGAVSTSEL